MPPLETEAADLFRSLRPRLIRLAYRMLGSIAEAEDIVQEAWLRWHKADRSAVWDPPAYLSQTVTRLCLDHLKSARVRRETYIGPWLPEPVFDAGADDPDEDLSLTLMMALERLSPLERAAFLLHDVFGMGFDEIATTLSREPAACRQLASRARKHVQAARPRYSVSKDEGQRIAEAFFAASRSGDVDALKTLLAETVVAYTEGGGVKIAALNPLHGFRRVARFFAGLAHKVNGAQPPVLYRGSINGLPGFVTLERGDVVETTALQVEDGRITAIYIVRNPEKLRHLPQMSYIRY
ncbi:sigma-70 family RNA polymerase sigma factor [Microvirga arabica]|uniref:sigma-70 family RNA polymerase sigma factor n=1 Tax=Microvirga arabica TaxID=1128671 RepID=UPI0028ADB532|nr:sigma-70 family RNA polymerase sigma factor [Microvirga arabica]